MIRLHSLSSANKPKNNRVGRGIASGRGKTAGRGTKGQKSRSGYNLPRRFEGGQSALIQRLPKIRGFKSHTIKPIAVNIKRIIDVYDDNETVNLESLIKKGLINKFPRAGVKIIGSEKLVKKISFEDVYFSQSVAKQIEEANPDTEQILKTPKVKKHSKAKTKK